ncbi:MAG TPA: sulfur carrier protein ThiS [Pirellulaceae bacterium]|nr:sulfur carrier protein ThiS [Pirellulaceae bacterium]HMO91044.1 sulfur carrier protein ThiS [Pirellulaceae bacterium]HMP68159.1 sulfur carrier protein ThiS [Pirellulaceae bacterium]
MNSSNEIQGDGSFEFLLNGRPHRVNCGTTVADLLKHLKVGSAVAVEIDGELIVADRHAFCTLRESNKVEVVTLAGGG